MTGGALAAAAVHLAGRVGGSGGDTIDGELPIPVADPDMVRSEADAILADSQFAASEPGPVQRALEWANEQFRRGLAEIVDGVGGSPLLGWVMIALVLAAVGYLLYRFLRPVRADPVTDRVLPVIEPERRATDWEAEADEHAAAGRHKDAVHCRYRALIGRLVDVGILADVAGRTSGEYRREYAASAPSESASFDTATEIFEEAWYGDRPTGAAELAAFLRASETILGATSGRVRA